MTSSIDILIAEPDKMYCDLLSVAFFSARKRYRVVALAHSASGIMSALQQRCPQVAIISSSLQDGPHSGIHILPSIRQAYPKIPLLVTVGAPSAELIVESFRLGADGVFNREDPFDLLCKSVDVLVQGQVWANTQQLRFVLEAFGRSPKRLGVHPQLAKSITKREAAVVRLAIEGLSNREIARQLILTEHTVKNYMFRIFEKLGVSNRVELVLSCIRTEEQVLEEMATRPLKVSFSTQKIDRLETDLTHRKEAL